MRPAEKVHRFDSVVAEPPAGVESAAVTASTSAAAGLALGGDEIIQLTAKPSPWFIALVSSNWIISLAVLGGALAIAVGGRWTWQSVALLQVLACVGVLRVGIATAQWASKLYVLTNRRVLRFRGVLKVDVAECPLSKVSHVGLNVTWYQRPLGLGTITMRPADDDGDLIVWEHLPHAGDVYDRLLRAVRKSQQ